MSALRGLEASDRCLGHLFLGKVNCEVTETCGYTGGNAKLLKDCSLFKSLLLLLLRGILVCLSPLAYSTFKINLSAVMFSVLLYLYNPLVSSLIVRVCCAIFLSSSFVCIHADSSSDSVFSFRIYGPYVIVYVCLYLGLRVNPATDLRNLISSDFILPLSDRSVVQFSQQ
jgi:hypothetical protein